MLTIPTTKQAMVRTLRETVYPGSVLAAALFTCSLVSQHPSASFDRVRRWDRTAVIIPNWKFFAPNPAIHDYALAYRILDGEGISREWRSFEDLTGRKPIQLVWFPEHRHDKAVFDACAELIELTSRSHFFDVTGTEPWKSIRNFVQSDIERAYANEPVLGCQFVVCRTPGFDDSEPTNILYSSAYIPLPERFQQPTTPTNAHPPRSIEMDVPAATANVVIS